MTSLDIATPTGPALADLDKPTKPRALFIVGHGAGGGVDAVDIVAARDACLAAHIAVARITQPYRVAGRRTPPPPKALDPAWIAAAEAVRAQRGLGSLPIIVGGRSSGARVACRTATEVGAAGVIALAFPVHPPGKPESTRIPELELPTVPVLVIQGDRDPFGMPPPAKGRTIIVIAGADHGLKKDRATIASSVVEFIDALV